MILALLASPAFAWTSVQSQFSSTIEHVEQMVWDGTTSQMVQRHGLSLLNVTWEDTGRYHGSAVGPNISDMTIGVRDARGQLHPMPVIRFDNFADRTADVRTDDFWLRTGNERGARLRSTSLASFLRNARSYLHDSDSWIGGRSSLLADRDSHVLVSAQACFLPIPREGQATFTPVIYNYQSYPGNPAVLTIVATREGTSMQVVENEGGYLSEELTFDDDGERAPFTATRLSDFQRDNAWADTPAAEDAGLDVVLLIQVPLKQKAPPPPTYWEAEEGAGDGFASKSAAAPMASQRSDVEQAVIGHGPVEGPYKELDGLAVERDPRFPVRVTVQFYKATSNGVVSDADIREIRREIDRVYADADWVGSLVVDGPTDRPTEWQQPQPRPPRDTGSAQWADPFWSWHKAR